MAWRALPVVVTAAALAAGACDGTAAAPQLRVIPPTEPQTRNAAGYLLTDVTEVVFADAPACEPQEQTFSVINRGGSRAIVHGITVRGNAPRDHFPMQEQWLGTFSIVLPDGSTDTPFWIGPYKKVDVRVVFLAPVGGLVTTGRITVYTGAGVLNVDVVGKAVPSPYGIEGVHIGVVATGAVGEGALVVANPNADALRVVEIESSTPHVGLSLTPTAEGARGEPASKLIAPQATSVVAYASASLGHTGTVRGTLSVVLQPDTAAKEAPAPADPAPVRLMVPLLVQFAADRIMCLAVPHNADLSRRRELMFTSRTDYVRTLQIYHTHPRTLHVAKVSWAGNCGCRYRIAEATPIPPGRTTSSVVEFHAYEEGPVEGVLRIAFADGLSCNAVVRGSVVFGELLYPLGLSSIEAPRQSGRHHTMTFPLRSSFGVPLEVQSVRVNSKHVAAQFDYLNNVLLPNGDSEVEIDVTAQLRRPLPQDFVRMEVHTNVTVLGVSLLLHAGQPVVVEAQPKTGHLKLDAMPQCDVDLDAHDCNRTVVFNLINPHMGVMTVTDVALAWDTGSKGVKGTPKLEEYPAGAVHMTLSPRTIPPMAQARAVARIRKFGHPPSGGHTDPTSKTRGYVLLVHYDVGDGDGHVYDTASLAVPIRYREVSETIAWGVPRPGAVPSGGLQWTLGAAAAGVTGSPPHPLVDVAFHEPSALKFRHTHGAPLVLQGVAAEHERLQVDFTTGQRSDALLAGVAHDVVFSIKPLVEEDVPLGGAVRQQDLNSPQTAAVRVTLSFRRGGEGGSASGVVKHSVWVGVRLDYPRCTPMEVARSQPLARGATYEFLLPVRNPFDTPLNVSVAAVGGGGGAMAVHASQWRMPTPRLLTLAPGRKAHLRGIEFTPGAGYADGETVEHVVAVRTHAGWEAVLLKATITREAPRAGAGDGGAGLVLGATRYRGVPNGSTAELRAQGRTTTVVDAWRAAVGYLPRVLQAAPAALLDTALAMGGRDPAAALSVTNAGPRSVDVILVPAHAWPLPEGASPSALTLPPLAAAAFRWGLEPSAWLLRNESVLVCAADAPKGAVAGGPRAVPARRWARSSCVEAYTRDPVLVSTPPGSAVRESWLRWGVWVALAGCGAFLAAAVWTLVRAEIRIARGRRQASKVYMLQSLQAELRDCEELLRMQEVEETNHAASRATPSPITSEAGDVLRRNPQPSNGKKSKKKQGTSVVGTGTVNAVRPKQKEAVVEEMRSSPSPTPSPVSRNSAGSAPTANEEPEREPAPESRTQAEVQDIAAGGDTAEAESVLVGGSDTASPEDTEAEASIPDGAPLCSNDIEQTPPAQSDVAPEAKRAMEVAADVCSNDAPPQQPHAEDGGLPQSEDPTASARAPSPAADAAPTPPDLSGAPQVPTTPPSPPSPPRAGAAGGGAPSSRTEEALLRMLQEQQRKLDAMQQQYLSHVTSAELTAKANELHALEASERNACVLAEATAFHRIVLTAERERVAASALTPSPVEDFSLFGGISGLLSAVGGGMPAPGSPERAGRAALSPESGEAGAGIDNITDLLTSLIDDEDADAQAPTPPVVYDPFGAGGAWAPQPVVHPAMGMGGVGLVSQPLAPQFVPLHHNVDAPGAGFFGLPPAGHVGAPTAVLGSLEDVLHPPPPPSPPALPMHPPSPPPHPPWEQPRAPAAGSSGRGGGRWTKRRR